MNPSKTCCLALALLTCSGVALAATERPGEAAAPVLVAAADPVVLPMRLGAAVDAKPESAGVAEALPESPEARTVALSATWKPLRPEPARMSFDAASLPSSPGVSLLQSSPLAGAARMVGAQHFNTDDGSSVSAFAICYRLNRRSSLQVIPGDPAPVKMPVTTMANNVGVTVGMVMRLSKRP